MECWDTAVSYMSWALVIGGVAYLLRQTRSCAEYGRYVPVQARCCSAKLGWFLQEVPAFLLPLLLLLFTAEPESGNGRWLLVCTFMLHYFHRSIIYAFLTRGRPIPLLVVASSVIFCSLNGFLQGHFLLHCAHFEDTWLTPARLTAGESQLHSPIIKRVCHHCAENVQFGLIVGNVVFSGYLEYVRGEGVCFFTELLLLFGEACAMMPEPTTGRTNLRRPSLNHGSLHLLIDELIALVV
uniref:3-oxo-5-alpha-steroid 4-dehydrogenase C-terminal domain-containing protein n=1 Tax=Amphilophus citrinellus TaxID=61819 RepID=A0A3Q0RCY5_AMPCI